MRASLARPTESVPEYLMHLIDAVRTASALASAPGSASERRKLRGFYRRVDTGMRGESQAFHCAYSNPPEPNVAYRGIAGARRAL
eukprot:361635-Chlamydomonas_euryale.AAC.2